LRNLKRGSSFFKQTLDSVKPCESGLEVKEMASGDDVMIGRNKELGLDFLILSI
jgi:hypothetical protein